MKRFLSRLFWFGLLSAIVLAFICSCESEEEDKKGSSSRKHSPFGLDVFLYRYAPFDMNDARRIADYAADANVRWTREEFEWAVVEPAKGELNTELLEAYDWVVDTHIDNGTRVFGQINYYAEWWTDHLAPSTTSQVAEYADYVQMLVTRYKGEIRHWEIWNEPNADEFWKPQPNPENYYKLLKAASIAAKEIDPTVKIIAFATSGTDISFIRSVLASGGYDYLDIICVHPYSYPHAFENTEIDAINDLKALMRRYGDEKPIWVSEIGYPTHIGATAASYQRQAEMVVRVYLSLIALGVEVICWYDLVDDGDDRYFYEVNFGLINSDLTPKLAYTAYKTMTSLMGNSTFVDEIFRLENNQNSSKALLFADSGSDILVCWTHDETIGGDGTVTTQNKNVSITYTGTVNSVVDIYNDDVAVGEDDGEIELTLTGSPVYLIGKFQVTGYTLLNE